MISHENHVTFWHPLNLLHMKQPFIYNKFENISILHRFKHKIDFHTEYWLNRIVGKSQRIISLLYVRFQFSIGYFDIIRYFSLSVCVSLSFPLFIRSTYFHFVNRTIFLFAYFFFVLFSKWFSESNFFHFIYKWVCVCVCDKRYNQRSNTLLVS